MSLEALERSDLSRLPGGIFTRAFIRAYAEEVGLDPDRTIQEFIAELPADAATATAHTAAVEDGEKLESDRRAVATALRFVLVSLPIIGLVIYYGTAERTGRASAVSRECFRISTARGRAVDRARRRPPNPSRRGPCRPPPRRRQDFRWSSCRRRPAGYR